MTIAGDALDDYREIIQRFRQMQLGERGGTLYIMRAGDTDLYKIGRTSGSVWQRRQQLAPGCPFELTIVADFGSRDIKRLEKEVHAALARSQTRGEWFELSREALRDARDVLIPGLLEKST